MQFQFWKLKKKWYGIVFCFSYILIIITGQAFRNHKSVTISHFSYEHRYDTIDDILDEFMNNSAWRKKMQRASNTRDFKRTNTNQIEAYHIVIIVDQIWEEREKERNGTESADHV